MVVASLPVVDESEVEATVEEASFGVEAESEAEAAEVEVAILEKLDWGLEVRKLEVRWDERGPRNANKTRREETARVNRRALDNINMQRQVTGRSFL